MNVSHRHPADRGCRTVPAQIGDIRPLSFVPGTSIGLNDESSPNECTVDPRSFT